MPDFAKVMAAALLMLAALFVLTSSDIFTTPAYVPTTGYVKYTTYEEKPAEEEKLLELPRKRSEIKTISLARTLEVSFSAEEKKIFAENFTVANGFGKREIFRKRFSLASLNSVRMGKLKINVLDTNLYGPLIIILNDEVIYENYTEPGSILEITINPSLLKEENEIVIFCGSSGWRLWAPTTYILSADLSIHYFELKRQELPFLVGEEEYKGLKLVRVLWYVKERKGNGSLIVKLNGIEIYRGRDFAPMIDLKPEEVKIRKGENILEFLVERNTAFTIEDIKVLLFYDIYPPSIIWFNLTQEEYAELKNKNATLKFFIERIEGDVLSLSIKITDARGDEHTIIPQGILREGRWYEIELTRNELSVGANKIEFKVSGEGRIVVRDVTLSL
jgi:hypothetical protein